MEERYLKFTQSRQEPLRLAIALQDYFLPVCSPEARQAYEAYLRRRIRPAASELVRAEEIDKLEQIAPWLSKELVEELLRMAAKEQRTAALVWLLRLKQEAYGFQAPEFPL